MHEAISKNNAIYFESARAYPSCHRGVKWASKESQFTRFKVLCEIASDSFQSRILDVGCGLGHLVDYLLSQSFTGTYEGIDIVDQMVVNAKKRHPTFDFKTNDIDAIVCGSVDYVMASGLFAFVDLNLIQEMIPQLFLRATKGLAFNCLSTAAVHKEADVFYQDPTEIINFCKSITPTVMLRHDYMPHDFTIYMMK